jgi:hypothetical protein
MWTADVSAGHDDQILTDPERLGVVFPVSEAYFNGSSRLHLLWDNLWRRDRLEIQGGAGGVLYGAKIEGGDSNLELGAAYRRHLSSLFVVDLAGTGFRFRRAATAEGRPVFDFDLYRADARAGWVVGRDWLWSAGIQHDWIDFPGRNLVADSTGFEEQKQLNLSVALLRREERGQFVAGELLYRWATSNVTAAEYEGPVFTLRTRANLVLGVRMSNYLAFGHRTYNAPADTVARRKDDTWQVGVRFSRALNRRLQLFLDGTFLHQASNRDPFAFDQTRVSLGVTLDLVPAPPWSPSGSRTSPSSLAPRITVAGVRFRLRDKEARSVALVGGFNGWDARADPLAGPDKNGVWEIVIPLKSGTWRYAFVVDGRWATPPEASRYEDDGFGGRHGVLEVSGG